MVVSLVNVPFLANLFENSPLPIPVWILLMAISFLHHFHGLVAEEDSKYDKKRRLKDEYYCNGLWSNGRAAC